MFNYYFYYFILLLFYVQCLRDYFGWEATCGYLQVPPDNIQPRDNLVYHSDGCG